jgi:acetylornithine deacetylase/succinyl-diaminopimelate desuccinylase-like protein
VTQSLPGWLPRALGAIRVERLVEIGRTLVDAHSPTGAELPAAEALAAVLARHGLPASIDRFAPGRANLVASVGTAPGGGRVSAASSGLLLCGHLDTTGYGDERDRPWLPDLAPSDLPKAHVEDGILSGLGAFNMKAGVAAAAEAVLALAEVGADLPGTVSLGAVAGESEKAPVRGLATDFVGQDYAGGGIGAERLLATAPRPDAVVICEPSGLAVINAQPGYAMLRLRILGRTGYLPGSGTPTVITALGTLVRAIDTWAAGWAERAALDCGLGTMRPTCSVGAVEAGAPFKPGGTPGVGALYADLRVPPGADAEAAIEDLTASCREALAGHGAFSLEVEVYARNLPGALTAADHPLVRAALAARQAVLGGPPHPPPDWDVVSGDDGQVFARAGIPYVKVGPASAADRDPRFGREQVRVAEMEQAARLYVELAARFLAPG